MVFAPVYAAAITVYLSNPDIFQHPCVNAEIDDAEQDVCLFDGGNAIDARDCHTHAANLF